ncbi:MAG: response regulator [Longimicrobiales bacterium]
MPTILFVEDHLEMRALHCAFLEQQGYRVVAAADGPSAVKAAHDYHPNIIILDHSLPGLTGTQVAEELKGDIETAAIPIVMVTAHAYGAVGRRARAAGCEAFLAKPCSPRRILDEIVRFIGPPN